MPPSDPPAVETTIRVRYAETDQMGVAYYASYLIWFEVARSEFCRARGIEYTEWEKQGLFLPVAEVRCRYRAPARYDDEILVAIRLVDRTRRTLRFAYRLTRGDTLIAEGETVQVLVGPDGHPRSFPLHLAERFSSVEIPAS